MFLLLKLFIGFAGVSVGAAIVYHSTVRLIENIRLCDEIEDHD